MDKREGSHHRDAVRVDPPLRPWARDFSDGHVIDRHVHDSGQLIHALSGAMRVRTDDACWLVPPWRAVWIPENTPHAVEMRGSVAMRTVYVPSAARAGLPAHCRVIDVGPVLAALIRAVAAERPPTARADRLRRALLIEELAAAPAAPFGLPLGRDARLRRATTRLTADPATAETLPSLAAAAGASARTLARLFARETGLGFAAWRQRLRLIEALDALGAGEPVGRVAARLGYRSPSAFGAMVRRATGRPPRAFRREPEPAPAPRHRAG